MKTIQYIKKNRIIKLLIVLITIIFLTLLLVINFKNPVIDNSGLNFKVPVKFSELCGYGERERCPEFYFVNGELPIQLKNNFYGTSSNANIVLELNTIKTGTLNLSNKKTINVKVIPYSWCWASCGQGIYIVESKEKAEVIGIINMDNKGDDINKIEIIENKIIISFINYKKTHTKECQFENVGAMEDLNLKCLDL